MLRVILLIVLFLLLLVVGFYLWASFFAVDLLVQFFIEFFQFFYQISPPKEINSIDELQDSLHIIKDSLNVHIDSEGDFNK
jgi:hypothetical protein